MHRYDWRQSYDWNYDHAPTSLPAVEVPPMPGLWAFCGIPINSPLGIPAGPLLNSRWIAYYARLGFDVLTYKTVRSRYRACFDPPNLLLLEDTALTAEGSTVRAATDEATATSWAISFGMPSKDPSVWRDDVSQARQSLAPGQVLVVSVVASPEPHWTLSDLARDFALCARWAVQSGAHAVEANLSCPNVCTAETDLYLSPQASAAIAHAIRTEIGDRPLILKIGLFHKPSQAEALVKAVESDATALATTNSITAHVADASGHPLFNGARRGIGGSAITARCLQELQLLAALTKGTRLKLISVGGVTTPEGLTARLNSGAHHVQLATAAMLNPKIAFGLRTDSR